MSARLFAFLSVAALASSGCFHVKSSIPGVLDLRSDGSDAPVATKPMEGEATRDGVGGFFLGAGAEGTSDVTVENRATFIGLSFYFLIHPLNGDVQDEWQSVLGKDGAARNVHIGESLTIGAFLHELVRSLICVPVYVFTPLTIDQTGSATRIETGGSSAAAATREESIPPALPPDGAAPPGTSF